MIIKEVYVLSVGEEMVRRADGGNISVLKGP
jgi:hypothetical protein